MDNPQTTTIDRIAEIEQTLRAIRKLGFSTAKRRVILLDDIDFLLTEIRRLQSELTQARDLLAKVQDGLTQELYEATQPKKP